MGPQGNQRLTSIVAMGLHGEIGVQNRLPWKLRSDLRFFKKTTLDNIIVMGRKTADSVGGSLPKRHNIVLSCGPMEHAENPNFEQAASVSEALRLMSLKPEKEAFVIGGALTYQAFSPFVDRYLITKVKGEFPEADAFFDRSILGDMANWSLRNIPVERVRDADADQYEFSVIELTHNRPQEIAARRVRAIADENECSAIASRGQRAENASETATLDQLFSFA